MRIFVIDVNEPAIQFYLKNGLQKVEGIYDERKILIRQKVGVPIMLMTSVVILFCDVVAGYFNIIIFYTLFAVSVVQLITCLLLKVIYIKKY